MSETLSIELLMIRTEALRIETDALHRHAARVQRAYEIERERRLVAEARCRELEQALSEAMGCV